MAHCVTIVNQERQYFERVLRFHEFFFEILLTQALQRVFFTQEEYTAMLQMYNEHDDGEASVDRVACRWMKENVNVWSQWQPADLKAKTELFIGGIFPITGPFYKSGRGMVPGALIQPVVRSMNCNEIDPAAQMAVGAINANSTILRDYELKLLVADGQCSADMVMKSFIDYLRFKHFTRMVGILGNVVHILRCVN